MKRFLIFSVVVFIYKLIRNIFNYINCKILLSSYKQYLSDGNNHLYSYKHKFIKLMKNANIDEPIFATATPIPGGSYASHTSSIFDVFPSKGPVVAPLTLRCFEEAIGEYRDRIQECFSLFYWIDIIVFLPKSLLRYLNIDNEKVAYKICNISLTILWWVVAIIAAIFDIKLRIFIG